jgi:hypothetical protein
MQWDKIPISIWLDPAATDPTQIADLLKPYDAPLMHKYLVSDFVNRADNEGPECAQEVVADAVWKTSRSQPAGVWLPMMTVSLLVMPRRMKP